MRDNCRCSYQQIWLSAVGDFLLFDSLESNQRGRLFICEDIFHLPIQQKKPGPSLLSRFISFAVSSAVMDCVQVEDQPAA